MTIRWNEMKPPARIRLLIALAVVTIATASCGGSGGSSASTRVGCSPSGAAASANSADYRYVLSVGPTEEMYSRSQVTASHPKTGEVMLNGAMSMAQGPGAQHLEVHICSRHGGDVVVGAPPSITVTDVTANITAAIPVATMQGVTAGQSDRHYGNNIEVPTRHSFVVHVGFGGQQATLRFTRPG